LSFLLTAGGFRVTRFYFACKRTLARPNDILCYFRKKSYRVVRMNRDRAFTEFSHAQAELEDRGESLACRDNSDFFFPEDYYVQKSKMLSERLAKMLCEECPIKDLCRDYAISAQEDYGIWGGTNPRERREARLELSRKNQIPQAQ
jgi:WhiB family redox-sensing transcriptional regulator